MADTKASAFTAITAPATSDGIPIIDDYGGTPLNRIITLLNLLSVINVLTADTAPDRTADYVATWDNSASQVKKVLAGKLGALNFSTGFTNSNPADNTSYYFGAHPYLSLGSTAADRRLYIPRAGIITAVDVYMAVTGTGSNETSTLSIRLNNTSNTTVTSLIALNTSPYHELKTGLTLAIAAGDYIEMLWATPAGGWATNPTGVFGWVQILME